MKDLGKYKYLIPAAIFLFLLIGGVGRPIIIILTRHVSCLSIFPSQNVQGGFFLALLFQILPPFIYLYTALVYFSMSSKPERDNKLTKVSLGLNIIYILATFVPGAIYFYPVLMFILLLAFVLLLSGNFNVRYLLFSSIVFLIFAGAYFSERAQVCQDSSAIPINANNETACKDVAEGLKDTCYKVVAQNTNNTKICDLISNQLGTDGIPEKDWCYRGVARINGNVEACTSLTDVDFKKGCVIEATR